MRTAYTTERAIRVLYAHPSLVAKVQTITEDVEANGENEHVLRRARKLLERFPADVQRTAAYRRVVASRRLAVMASVRAAQSKKYGEGGQPEPVSCLLEALGDAPGDVLRVIVEFVGEEVEETLEQRVARLERGNSRREENERRASEQQRRVIEEQRREIEEQRKKIAELEREVSELKGETSVAGRKRGREE